MKAFIVTEDYNRLGKYRWTAFSERPMADLYSRAASEPAFARQYVTGSGSPAPARLDVLAEVHVSVHEVPWPTTDGKPAQRATVIGLSEQAGFVIQLLVVAVQPDMRTGRQFPWLDGYTPICPEDGECDFVPLVLDGPTLESGDTAI